MREDVTYKMSFLIGIDLAHMKWCLRITQCLLPVAEILDYVLDIFYGIFLEAENRNAADHCAQAAGHISAGCEI